MKREGEFEKLVSIYCSNNTPEINDNGKLRIISSFVNFLNNFIIFS